MKLDRFINRPVLSTVISVLIVILGIIGLATLPVTQYPDIAPPTVQVRATYTGANSTVHAGSQRCDDRLHLFCYYGIGGDFRGGRGYRESPQLVKRKLFRNDLGQCESDEYRGGSDFTYGDPVSKAAGSLPAG